MPEPDAATLAAWNALAAEHLAGWRWMFCTDGSPSRYLVPPGAYPFTSEGWIPATGEEPVFKGTIWPVPDYSGSRDAVATLEAIVRERGLQGEYVTALGALMDMPNIPQMRAGALYCWYYATAPAWVRLEAVLRVCGAWDEQE